MNTYYFCLDIKVTLWQREYHKLEAETEEEAVEKMKKAFKEDNTGDTYDDYSEDLYDTLEEMSVEENNGQFTKELIIRRGMGGDETIATNMTEPFI